jgi:hypothetical protein
MHVIECVHKHIKGDEKRMGWRGRGRYPGNGPYRNTAPRCRQGILYGYGRGYRPFSNPTKCSSFPWLKRWWWANPDSKQGNTPNRTNVPLYPLANTSDQEKEMLQQDLNFMIKEMEAIKKRLQELETGE